MSDSPVRTLVKIGDPTTAANEAAVNASGELTVVEASGADILTAVQLIDDAIFVDDTATHATGTTKGMGIMAVAVPTDGAVDANDIAMPAMSLDRRLHVDADITASVALDVSAATVTVDGTGTFVVQEDGAALTALALIDDVVAVLGTATYSEATTKGNIIGVVRNDALGTLVDTDNEIAPLQVNASGALYCAVTEGGGETVPVGELFVTGTTTDLATDAEFDVDAADAGGDTKKIRGFDASASVPIKVELKTVIDNIETVRMVLFAAAGQPIQWRAPHRDYFEQIFTANAGFDGFRITITNKDSSDAADVYGTIYTED